MVDELIENYPGCSSDTVAYSSERLFQIESNIPVQFESEDDMMVYIWSNYNRLGDDNGYSCCNAKVYGS